MSSGHCATTGRCCRSPRARITSPWISGRPRARSCFSGAHRSRLIAASRKWPILGHRRRCPVDGPDQHRAAASVIARLLQRTDHDPDHASRRISVPIGLAGPAGSAIPCRNWLPHECEEMVAAVAGGDIVSRRITSQIVERTDGVPLFVEEYTRAVIDSGAIERDRRRSGVGERLSKPLVPSSIHDSLMERLDRLGPAKRVAQIASVFGRQFNYEGILNMLPGQGKLLKHALEALESAEHRVSDRGTARRPVHVQARDDPGSGLFFAAAGGQARAPCARGVVAACRRLRSGRAASLPCSAITMRARATFRRRSRHGFRRANPRSAVRPPRRPWFIFARASR